MKDGASVILVRGPWQPWAAPWRSEGDSPELSLEVEYSLRALFP